MTYYHGGQAGLRVGDFILPVSETGVRPSIDYDAQATEEEKSTMARVYARNRVYFTTELEAARMFAGLHPSGTGKRGGDVYAVEPEGHVEDDPDYLGDDKASKCASRARITAIVATGVRRKPYLAMAGLNG